MAIAKVEPLVTARALRGPFDYRLPPEMEHLGVGSVLRVPFGRQRLLGVVVEVAETSDLPPERLAEPLEALEAGVPPELVRLGLWTAREWCSTPSRGLGLVLPPGTGRGGQRAKTQTELSAELTDAGRGAAAGDGEVPDGGRKLGVRQRAALRALLSGSRTSSELREEVAVEPATLRRLEDRGLLRLERVERRRGFEEKGSGAAAKRVTLTQAQEAAAGRIVERIGDGGSFLLHGVTGSGKTEVYLTAAEAALASGRGAIILVPEIALTPQTVGRVRARLGETVALLHSRMPVGARYDEWRRLRSGEARVCVGPRSAVFAPVADLGLLVIDEEHDASYKQESDPRYDARTVARRRAAEAGAVLVCGTATPRPESWHELERLNLPERVDDRRLPPVELVDMRGTDSSGGSSDSGPGPPSGPLHPATLEALSEVAKGGGKAILMLNRRGWSPHIACRSCGEARECPDCDVSLVLHGREDLRCHHCGHSERLPESCPECGSVSLARVGAGTERVTAEIEQRLAPLPVFRLDSDAAAASGAHGGILRRFDEAESGVLVGTQMVGKGHDFPEVTLAAVIDADATLRFPDFRSEERTFALITQLAGRSGRGKGGGKVIVQTLSPDAPSIIHAASHDAAGFLSGELERRQALRYPPFSSLVEVQLASPDEDALDWGAEEMRRAVAERLADGVELLGPAPLFRLRGRHRRRLVLKSPAQQREATVAAVREAVEASAGSKSLREVSVSVDVDPQ